MTQRLACLSISDPTHLEGFISAHGELVDVAAGFAGGGWGLGVWRAGEMLTRKTPVTATFDGLKILGKSNARQCVLMADANAVLRSSRATMQPIRFRDWIFAVTGTVADVDGFIARSKAELAGFGKAGPTFPDLAMTTMMHALYRANVLDRRPLSTSAYHAAIARGVERLREYAGGGDDALQLSFVMHVEGYLLSVAAGRELRLHERADESPRGRNRKWWATLVTDFAEGDPVEESTFTWGGVEVDSHGKVKRFDIA